MFLKEISYNSVYVAKVKCSFKVKPMETVQLFNATTSYSCSQIIFHIVVLKVLISIIVILSIIVYYNK